jgi:hypothetical protein
MEWGWLFGHNGEEPKLVTVHILSRATKERKNNFLEVYLFEVATCNFLKEQLGYQGIGFSSPNTNPGWVDAHFCRLF